MEGRQGCEAQVEGQADGSGKRMGRFYRKDEKKKVGTHSSLISPALAASMHNMRFIYIMLLLPLALFPGCEEGSNGDGSGATATNQPPAATVVDETSTGLLTTTIISATHDPNASGPPYEGDTKIEEYVFTKPDGTAGNSTKTYVYTDGEWALTDSSGDPF